MTSSLWVTFGVFGGQAIRLVSNLILTRLLVPEYFGIMAIVNSVLTFFVMMTDIGLFPSVVNTKRDKDPAFMQTVWTVQFLSSSAVCLFVLLAAYPVSQFYDEPMLFPLISFAAITALLSGLKSTSILIEQKYIRQKKLVLSEITSQIISSMVMIGVAYYSGSVWSLIAGNVVGIALVVLFSYTLFENHYSKWSLDRQSLVELISFGKWIFLSSIFSFVSAHSRPLILGIYFSMSQLGIYAIAANLATIIEKLSNTLSGKILLPRYRELITENDIDAISQLRYKYILVFIGPTIILAVTGHLIVSFMYDARYEWAGLILEVLVLGRIGSLLSSTARPLLSSVGDSKALMFTQWNSAVLSTILIVAAAEFGPTDFLIIMLAVVPFVDYFLVVYTVRTRNLNIFRYDALICVFSISTIFLVWYLTNSKTLDLFLNF